MWKFSFRGRVLFERKKGRIENPLEVTVLLTGHRRLLRWEEIVPRRKGKARQNWSKRQHPGMGEGALQAMDRAFKII